MNKRIVIFVSLIFIVSCVGPEEPLDGFSKNTPVVVNVNDTFTFSLLAEVPPPTLLKPASNPTKTFLSPPTLLNPALFPRKTLYCPVAFLVPAKDGVTSYRDD